MDYETFKQSAIAPLLLVSDPVAAQRWETHWLRVGTRSEPLVAPRPPVRSVTGAIADTLLSPDDAYTGRSVLSAVQSGALWREVVAASRYGQSLISAFPAAAAAESAWRLLHEWDVPWERLRADGDDPDFAALLAWCHAYSRRLREEGWHDRPTIVRQLAMDEPPRVRQDIAAALSEPLSPLVSRVFAQRARRGHVTDLAADGGSATATFVLCDDPDAELSSAADWAAHRLAEVPGSLVAIVVPDARQRASLIEMTVRDSLATSAAGGTESACWSSCGRPLLDFGATGAAMNALELIFGRGQFGHLSSFLRSPFFAGDEIEGRARRSGLEVELRTRLFTQWRFADAMRQAGLQRVVTESLPVTGGRLSRAVDLADRRGGTLDPTSWVDLWEQVLRLLGWRPASNGTSADVLSGWDHCLRSFASTSSIIGQVRAARALQEFRRIATAATVRMPMTLRGVHILERPQQVGPGYAGVRVTGFTDRRWPESMRPNPLLPAKLQRVHAMPGATPEVAQARSVTVLRRLLANASNAQFSAPARIDDEPMRPSRMLTLQPAATSTLQHKGYIARRVGARAGRMLDDPVPAAAVDEFSGGTRLLELQAQCPVRAFCEIRLGARALERPLYGISPRLRGIVLHRALELILRPWAGRGPVKPGDLEDSVEGAVGRALSEHIPWREAPWDLIAELEVARACRAISTLLDAEMTRERVEIVAVEAPVVLDIDRWTIRGRIDRVDRLPSGDLAIIDYKTGAAPAASAWFSERLLAPQMPAYALACDEEVAAFVIAAIGDGRVDYRAAGLLPDDFPVRPRQAPTADEWNAQRALWRRQIAALLAEFAAGDVRVAAVRPTYAAGEFAALTRLFDVGALAIENGADAAGLDD